MRFVKILFSTLFVVAVVFSLYVRFSDKTDYAAPEILCDSDVITVSVNDSNEKILSFVSAHDSKDGDLSKDVIVESISPFIGECSAKITFAVCDSDSNVTKLEKDIVYSDYTAPEFSFDKQHVYYIGGTKVDLLSEVSATDCLDGDISNRIVIAESQIDLSEPGIYPITYRVTSSKGVTSEISINAYVYSSRLSEHISLKSYLVYTDKQNKIDPEMYIDSYPEELLDKKYNDSYEYSFDIIDDVDYTKPGIHYITYRLSRTPDNARNNSEVEIMAEAYLAVAVRGDSQ